MRNEFSEWVHRQAEPGSTSQRGLMHRGKNGGVKGTTGATGVNTAGVGQEVQFLALF